jgi:hypothetical protein
VYMGLKWDIGHRGLGGGSMVGRVGLNRFGGGARGGASGNSQSALNINAWLHVLPRVMGCYGMAGEGLKGSDLHKAGNF